MPGTNRHGALHDDRLVSAAWKIVDDRVDAREIGVAGVGRRRIDAHEQHASMLHDRYEIELEVKSALVLRDELPDARLEDRHLAGAKCVELVRVDVAAPDLVPELGEAGCAHEPDPPHTDHPYRRLGGHCVELIGRIVIRQNPGSTQPW